MEQIIDAFKGKKVLIVGDVMVDAYIMGKVERMSPEAPVPVVNIEDRDSRLGQRLFRARLGAGLELRQELASQFVSVHLVLQLLQRSRQIFLKLARLIRKLRGD